MSLSNDDAFELARRIGNEVLADYKIESIGKNPLPKLKPGATYVCYRERPGSAKEVDIIVKSHHGFLESSFQFPLISLLALLLVEADEMFRDPTVQRYFDISMNEA